MMKLKRIVSAAVCTAIFATSLFCGSAAAEAKSSKMKLITAPVKQALGTDYFEYMGDGVYMTDNGFYRIDSRELAEWRSKGKLKATKLKTNFKIPENWDAIRMGFNYGSYSDIYGRDNNGDVSSLHVVKYNKSKEMIEKYFDANYAVNTGVYKEETYNNSEEGTVDWIGCSFEGYIIKSHKDAAGVKAVTLSTPEGKSFTNFFENSCGGVWCPPIDEKYIYFTAYSVNEHYSSYYRDSVYTARLVGVDKQGKEHIIKEFESTYFSFSTSYGVPSDRTLFYWHRKPGEQYSKPYMYFVDEKRAVDLSDVLYGDTKTTYNGKSKVIGKLSQLEFSVNGLAHAHYRPDGTVYSGSYGEYRILDVSSRNASFFSQGLKSAYFADYEGDYYYLRTFDGKSMIMSTKTGQVLGEFDYVSCMNGKYIAVNEGKAVYLIDKDMNRVSEKLNGYEVWDGWRLSDGLFAASKGGEYYFLTYADNGEKPDKPKDFEVSSSKNSVKLTWKTSETAEGYEVLYSTAKNSGYKRLKKIKNGYTCTLTVNGLKEDVTYYFVIRSYRTYKGKIIYSSKSSPIKLEPVSTKKPKTAKLTVEWDEVFGSDGYVIYLSEGNKKNFKKIKTINDGGKTSATISGLEVGKVYYLKIRSFTIYHGEKVYCETSEIIRIEP